MFLIKLLTNCKTQCIRFYNNFCFYIWSKEMAGRLKNNPFGAFAWEMRMMVVYRPLFEREGFKGVMKEHKRYIQTLWQQLNKD